MTCKLVSLLYFSNAAMLISHQNLDFLIVFTYSSWQVSPMRPHTRHDLWEEKEFKAFMNCWHFKCTHSTNHIVHLIIIVVIRDKLTINIFLMPLFRDLVKQNDCFWNFFFDSAGGWLSETWVFCLIVASVPLVRMTVLAMLNNKDRFVFVKFLSHIESNAKLFQINFDERLFMHLS